MHQRLVIAMLIKAIELDRMVEEQAIALIKPGDHDALIGRRFGKDHLVLKQARVDRRHHPFTHRKGHRRRDQEPGPRKPYPPPEPVAEDV